MGKRGPVKRLQDLDRKVLGKNAPVDRPPLMWRWGNWIWRPPVWLLVVIIVGVLGLKSMRSPIAHVAGAIILLLAFVLTINGSYRNRRR